MKVLKVVPCYPYISRRETEHNSPTSYADWENAINNLVNAEMNIDSGVEMDLLLYRMYESREFIDLAYDFLHSFNGKKIYRGNIKVVDLENSEPNGFKTIIDAVEHYYNEYDFLIIQEDDHYILPEGEGYLAHAVNSIETYGLKGGVIFAPAKNEPQFHFGGFFGLIPMENLRKGIKTFPRNPMKNEINVCQWYLNTNELTAGDFGELTGYSNVPDNWMNIRGFNRVPRELIRLGVNFFHVGK